MPAHAPAPGPGPALSPSLTGFLIVNKPASWTSFDVVNKVRSTIERALDAPAPAPTADDLPAPASPPPAPRRRARRRSSKPRIKVGHGGTLDPLATGVLVLGVGARATRALHSLLSGAKTYHAVARFGHETTTEDADGERTEADEDGAWRAVTRADMQEFIGRELVGDKVRQVPPAFSALKVAGKRAYALARDGGDVRLEAREVRIVRVDVVGCGWWEGDDSGGGGGGGAGAGAGGEEALAENEVALDVECGGGTYVRSLVRDLERGLGTRAHLGKLIRTSQGEAKLGPESGCAVLEEGDLKDVDRLLGNMGANEALFARLLSESEQASG